MTDKALVVLSGGQDSTTCLYWAIDRFAAGNVLTVTFDYGQRHRIELECAREIANFTGVPNVVLPIDTAAIHSLHESGFEIGVETNGTIEAPAGIDWLCVSPKGNAPVAQLTGDELKLVFPQVEEEAQPERFAMLEFRHFYIQPMDGPDIEANTKCAIEFCLNNPQWRLSVQTHKYLGID